MATPIRIAFCTTTWLGNQLSVQITFFSEIETPAVPAEPRPAQFRMLFVPMNQHVSRLFTPVRQRSWTILSRIDPRHRPFSVGMTPSTLFPLFEAGSYSENVEVQPWKTRDGLFISHTYYDSMTIVIEDRTPPGGERNRSIARRFAATSQPSSTSAGHRMSAPAWLSVREVYLDFVDCTEEQFRKFLRQRLAR